MQLRTAPGVTDRKGPVPPKPECAHAGWAVVRTFLGLGGCVGFGLAGFGERCAVGGPEVGQGGDRKAMHRSMA